MGLKSVICKSVICGALLVSALLGGCDSLPKRDNKVTPLDVKDPTSLKPFLLEAAQESSLNQEYAEAAAYWGALYEADPNDPNAALQCGVNLRYAGNPEDALNILSRALKTHPGNVQLLTERAKAYVALGSIDPAQEDITAASASNPADWTLYSTQGVIFDRLGRHNEAEDAYNKALGLSPDNPKILNNMALSLALAGRHDEAIETLNRAAQNPNIGIQIRQNMSLLIAMKGDTKAAGKLTRADLPNKLAENNIAYFEGLTAIAAP